MKMLRYDEPISSKQIFILVLCLSHL